MHFSKPPLGTPLDWENPLNVDTVLALAMNEGHGDKVQDLSMYGNHGTLNNFAFPPTAASGWNPGQTGIGLNLDGADDHINCGDNPSLSITDAITLSALVRPETQIVSGVSSIIAGKPDISYHLYIFTAQKRLVVNIGGNVYQTANDVITLDSWQQVSVTYDKNAGANNLNMYIDGVNEKTDTSIDAIGGLTGDVVVGTNWWLANNYDFIGSLDQPRIMNRAWSAKEVRDYAINPWQVYLDEDD